MSNLNIETSRRGFLLIGTSVLLSGCTAEYKSRYKNRKQDKPGKNAKNKNRKDNRKYPCGLYKPWDKNTWEYTVVTTNRYTIKINGRLTKTHKIFTLCGKQNADAWRRAYPKDSVRKTS